MKKLIVLPAVLLLLACQDHNPVQPEPEVALELVLAQAPGGKGKDVKMVPFKGKKTWHVVGFEPVVEDNEMKVFVEFEGNATHLGRFQGEMTAHYELLLFGHDEDGNPIYYRQTICHTAADLPQPTGTSYTTRDAWTNTGPSMYQMTSSGSS